MHIDYEISEQDFLDTQSLALKSSPIPGLRWSRVVLPVFGLLLLAALIYTAARQGFSMRALPGLLFGIVFCLFWISLPLLSKQKQKAVYAKSKGLHGRLAIEIDDDGIQFQGPLSSAKTGWPYFSKFFDDDKTFIFYQDNEQIFHMLPKRFLSPEQVVEFRKFFERHVGRK